MPQSDKFIVYFSISFEMAYCKAGLDSVSEAIDFHEENSDELIK